MRKLFLLVWVILPMGLAAEAKDLSTLVREKGLTIPDVTMKHFPNSPYARQLVPTLQGVMTFTYVLSQHVLVPAEIEFDITRGKHYLEAHCYPFDNSIVIDESAWATGNPLVYNGLLAHELGHLIFRESVGALLLDRFPDMKNNTGYQDLARLIISDDGFLERLASDLSQKHPGLSRMQDEKPAIDAAPIAAYSQYRLAESVRRAMKANEKSQEEFVKNLTGEKAFRHLILEALGGFQEVFADLVGAVYTKNPRYLVEVLNDPFSQYVRDFTRDTPIGHPSMPQVHYLRLITSASRGVPHLLLYELRQQLYDQFYRKNGIEIGKNEAYDYEVLQKVMSSVFKVFVKVYVEKDDPKVKTAEAAMALILREMINGVLYEWEVEAKAFCTKYHLRRVEYTSASDPGLSNTSTCSSQVASQTARPAVHRERVRESAREEAPKTRSQSQGQRYREMGQ